MTNFLEREHIIHYKLPNSSQRAHVLPMPAYPVGRFCALGRGLLVPAAGDLEPAGFFSVADPAVEALGVTGSFCLEAGTV